MSIVSNAKCVVKDEGRLMRSSITLEIDAPRSRGQYVIEIVISTRDEANAPINISIVVRQ